jgi:hypothetical protein
MGKTKSTRLKKNTKQKGTKDPIQAEMNLVNQYLNDNSSLEPEAKYGALLKRYNNYNSLQNNDNKTKVLSFLSSKMDELIKEDMAKVDQYLADNSKQSSTKYEYLFKKYNHYSDLGNNNNTTAFLNSLNAKMKDFPETAIGNPESYLGAHRHEYAQKVSAEPLRMQQSEIKLRAELEQLAPSDSIKKNIKEQVSSMPAELISEKLGFADKAKLFVKGMFSSKQKIEEQKKELLTDKLYSEYDKKYNNLQVAIAQLPQDMQNMSIDRLTQTKSTLTQSADFASTTDTTSDRNLTALKLDASALRKVDSVLSTFSNLKDLAKPQDVGYINRSTKISPSGLDQVAPSPTPTATRSKLTAQGR